MAGNEAHPQSATSDSRYSRISGRLLACTGFQDRNVIDTTGFTANELRLCEKCAAALVAAHCCRVESLDDSLCPCLAKMPSNLQEVIRMWNRLPDSIWKAIVALATSQ